MLEREGDAGGDEEREREGERGEGEDFMCDRGYSSLVQYLTGMQKALGLTHTHPPKNWVERLGHRVTKLKIASGLEPVCP